MVAVAFVLLVQLVDSGQMEELQLRSGTGGGGSGTTRYRTGAADTPGKGRGQAGPAPMYAVNDIECPSFAENSACPCYKFEDGKYSNPHGLFGFMQKCININ